MTLSLLALGCNQGDCASNLDSAVQKIDDLQHCRVLKTSSFLGTKPVGNVEGQFLNGALLVDTKLSSSEWMTALLEIEEEAGRDRQQSQQNRPLDLDILLFGQQVIDSEHLTVPHSRMSFRRFVLQPAHEIAPDLLHPIINCTIAELWNCVRLQRNVIAVLADPFDPNQETVVTDKHDSTTRHWLDATDQRTALRAIRQHIWQDDHWFVVVAKDFAQLNFLRGCIKLLIHSQNPTDATMTYRGPQWCLPKDQFSNMSLLKIKIETAIASLSGR